MTRQSSAIECLCLPEPLTNRLFRLRRPGSLADESTGATRGGPVDYSTTQTTPTPGPISPDYSTKAFFSDPNSLELPTLPDPDSPLFGDNARGQNNTTSPRSHFAPDNPYWVGLGAGWQYVSNTGGRWLTSARDAIREIGLANIDALGLALDTGATYAGMGFNYQPLSQAGRAAVFGNATVMGNFRMLGTGILNSARENAVDTGSLGVVPIYQYLNGQISAEQFTDRMTNVALTFGGTAFGLRGTLIGNSSIRQVPNLAMEMTKAQIRSSIEHAIEFAPGYAQGLANGGLRKSFEKAMRELGVIVKFEEGGGSYFSRRTRTAVIDRSTATPGTLTDEFSHAFNNMIGRGKFLPEHLAQLHKRLATKAHYLGDTNRLGLAHNSLYHQLELLNFLESGRKLPGFIRVIPRSEIDQFLAPVRALTSNDVKAILQSL